MKVVDFCKQQVFKYEKKEKTRADQNRKTQETKSDIKTLYCGIKWHAPKWGVRNPSTSIDAWTRWGGDTMAIIIWESAIYIR